MTGKPKQFVFRGGGWVLIAVATALAASGGYGQPPQSQPGFPSAGLVNPRPPFLAVVKVNHDDLTYEDGDHLALKFAAERDAFLYLLYHQADGRTLLLYPNSAQPDNRVPARKTVQIPAAGQPFGIRIGPPFGNEAVQVLASVARIADLDALVPTPAAQPVVSRQVLDQLARRLAMGQAAWAEHRTPIRTVAAKNGPEARPNRIGLFIGIGKYLNPKIGETHDELRHSAEVMHQAMLARGKLDPQRTRLVLDQEATRANLESLIFHWLPENSRPGDVVVIYYSGHAGVAESAEGAWAEGSALLGPYDLDAGTREMTFEARSARWRETGILSETLARWLEELAGRQVVLILDTCHSGGMLQGKEIAKALSRKADRLKDLAQMNLVVLSACARDEQALFEGTPNKTMWFTYFLCEALEKIPAPVTVQAAHRYALEGMQQIVRARHEPSSQEPQLSDSALLPINLVP
ncbi:MAG: DUF4384 domain-containing protein [Thermoguttaceae bacterium]